MLILVLAIMTLVLALGLAGVCYFLQSIALAAKWDIHRRDIHDEQIADIQRELADKAQKRRSKRMREAEHV